jgi:hypothetical protein
VTRRPRWRVAGLVALSALWLLGCGKDHGSGSTKNAPLFEFNAQQNGGRTVRWPNLPVRVFLGGGAARPDEVNIWMAATDGAVTFTFVGSAGAANVRFGFRSGTDICGVTFLEFTDEGDLTQADVQVSQSIYRGPQCQRTVTHETAHAIGFLGHTADGGLMDPDGGDGGITPLVAGVLRDLYRLAPGTFVSAETKRLGLRRPGGKNVMTFVYPVRQ